MTAANDLPVARFAIHPDNRARPTETYGYNLLRNYSPEWRWQESIRALRRPVMVLAGVDEDIFIATAYDAVFKEAPGLRGVKQLRGINHAMLTLDPGAITAIVAATDSLQALAKTGTAR